MKVTVKTKFALVLQCIRQKILHQRAASFITVSIYKFELTRDRLRSVGRSVGVFVRRILSFVRSFVRSFAHV